MYMWECVFAHIEKLISSSILGKFFAILKPSADDSQLNIEIVLNRLSSSVFAMKFGWTHLF